MQTSNDYTSAQQYMHRYSRGLLNIPKIAQNKKTIVSRRFLHTTKHTGTQRMTQALIGIMGGSGLYQMEGLQDSQEHIIDTPFGAPADVVVTGKLHGGNVAFLARHARGHRKERVGWRPRPSGRRSRGRAAR